VSTLCSDDSYLKKKAFYNTQVQNYQALLEETVFMH